MSKVNELGLDVFGFGIGTEAESYVGTPETPAEEGMESVDEVALMDDILALCEANESLDTQYAVGLVGGLESIHDTYQLILMANAKDMMDAGIESEDIGTMLAASGLAVSDFEAGTEANEGGLVSPLRKAKNYVRDSKAYKAVADSFVGKGTKAVVEKIKKFLNWLKEFIFGKAQKQVDAAQEQIKSLSGKVAELEKAAASTKKQSAYWKEKCDKLAKSAKSLGRGLAGEKAKSARLERVNAGLKDNINDLQMKYDNYVLAKEEQEQIDGEAYDAMKAALTAKIEAEKRATAAAQALVTKLQGDVSRLKDENTDLSAQKDNIINQYIDEINTLSERIVEVEAVQPAGDSAVAAASAVIEVVSNQQAAEIGKVTSQAVQSKKLYAHTMMKAKQLIQKIGGFSRAKSGLIAKGGTGRNPRYNTKLGKDQYMMTPGLARSASGARYRGNESEEFDLSSIFLMDGTESEVFGLDEEYYVDYEEAMESPYVDIALAKLDMLYAVEAGNEAMTMEHFGHEFIGLDIANAKVYGITPGVEAEDLSKESAKTEEKKDDKKEGGFKNALSKFGRGVKNTPSWIMKQIKKFIKWLMSKSVIMDRMFSKLSGLFSRNVNVKDVFVGEKRSYMVNLITDLVYNIKKASYDLEKLTNKESKAEEPSKEAITKEVSEKLDKLEKVNTGNFNSALDRIGLSDAAKELAKLRKKLSAGSLEKMVKKETISEATSKELAKTMAGLNGATQRLGVFIKSLISDAKIATNKEKEAEKAKAEAAK